PIAPLYALLRLPLPDFSYLHSLHPSPPTYISTLSLHDALPIYRLEDDRMLLLAERIASRHALQSYCRGDVARVHFLDFLALVGLDRKSTRLNSSHGSISYAVFCLKKKK